LKTDWVNGNPGKFISSTSTFYQGKSATIAKYLLFCESPVRETIEVREETGEKLPIVEVAAGLGTTRKTLSAIINGKQRVTPVVALRLAAAFANTLQV